MEENFPLEAYLEAYNLGEMDKRELEGVIFEHILQNYHSFHLKNWDKEDCIDFLCWLYPRLSRAIDNYRSEGSTFDAYIGTMVRLTAREFRTRIADHAITEQAYWDNAVEEDEMVYEEEPEYPEENALVKPIHNPQQALLLLLKSYYFVSDDFLDRIAPALWIDKATLLRLIEEMKQVRLNQDNEIQSLKERIHTQYFRIISYERKMEAANPLSYRYELMKRRKERAIKLLHRLRKRLKSKKVGASNREIALVLGIPKGTVDASLSAVKAKSIGAGEDLFLSVSKN